MSDLKKEILARIDPVTFYKSYGLEVGKNNLCPFHSDTNPSLKINEDGSFRCFSEECSAWGSSIVSFYEKKEGVEFKTALMDLYDKYVDKIVDGLTLLRYHHQLLTDKPLVERIKRERGWTDEVIKKFKLGWHKERVTIPVANKFGLITIVLCYDIFGKHKQKFVYLHKGMKGRRLLFPVQILQGSSSVLFTEGFSDTITAISHGFAAVTTGSAGNWDDSNGDLFAGKNVIVVPHQDAAGIKGAQWICRKLIGKANEIKIVNLPFNNGALTDLTEWLIEEGHKRHELEKLIKNAKTFEMPPSLVFSLKGEKSGGALVPFEKVADEKYFSKRIKFRADVVARGDSVFSMPAKVRLTCKDNKGKKRMCKVCELAKTDSGMVVIEIDRANKDILRFTNCTVEQQQKSVKDLFHISNRCFVDYEIMKTYSAEHLLLAHTVDPQKVQPVSTQVSGYYLGPILQINRSYVFEGIPVLHPKDNSLTLLILDAVAVSSSIESFVLTDGIRSCLMKFQADDIKEKLHDIYWYYENNVTNIKDRFWLHVGIDLVFFSPIKFIFNGELINGPLDMIAFGDPRCGKTAVAQGLSRYYAHGEVISGENVSYMNLVAGITLANKFRGVRFGRFAANHLGTLIIDEVSALDKDLLAKTSRARSEGVVEIDKDGKHLKAPALCGKIWLSNPRDSRLMKQFSYGVEALKSLFPAPEDLARFDYAIAVAADEVDSDEINTVTKDVETTVYPGPDNHNLIMWAKSRSVEQVQFSTAVTEYILDSAQEMGKKYTNKIPLVQAENMRVKLARIAAAVAARTFSTLKGKNIIVDMPHGEFAVEFITEIYAKRAMNYELYSTVQKQYDIIDRERILNRFIGFYAREDFEFHRFVDKLLGSEYITIQDLENLTGVEFYEAKKFLSFLVNQNCLKKVYSSWIKTSAFISFLKDIRSIDEDEIERRKKESIQIVDI